MELIEEEKEAIDYLKNNIESYVYLLNNDDKRKNYYIKEYPDMEAKRILLNLVKNQQEKVKQLEKEIERLEKDNDTLSELVIVNEDKVIKELDLISKYKIREMIKHYNDELEYIKNGEEFENEKPMYYWGKVALENLLEENDE